MSLKLDPNLADPDAVYQRLVAMHEGLTEAESNAANARLILLLVNHIGDASVIDAAIAAALAAGRRGDPGSSHAAPDGGAVGRHDERADEALRLSSSRVTAAPPDMP
jgi:hypothetical protein